MPPSLAFVLGRQAPREPPAEIVRKSTRDTARRRTARQDDHHRRTARTVDSRGEVAYAAEVLPLVCGGGGAQYRRGGSRAAMRRRSESRHTYKHAGIAGSGDGRGYFPAAGWRPARSAGAAAGGTVVLKARLRTPYTYAGP